MVAIHSSKNAGQVVVRTPDHRRPGGATTPDHVLVYKQGVVHFHDVNSNLSQRVLHPFTKPPGFSWVFLERSPPRLQADEGTSRVSMPVVAAGAAKLRYWILS